MGRNRLGSKSTKESKMKTIPQLIYDSFEMDQIGRPEDDEDLSLFAARVENAELFDRLGDTLILFIVRELDDPYEDRQELADRIDRAALQMLTFSTRLQHWLDSQEENQ